MAIPPGITIAPPRALGVTRFVAFGDSITWGATSAWFSANMFFAAANGGYPERLAANLTLAHTPQPITMFNDGLPGELAVNALTRFRTMLTTRRPGAVLLLEGINDLSNDISVSRTIGGLRAMLDAAGAQGVPVLLATMYQTYEVVDPDGNFRRERRGLRAGLQRGDPQARARPPERLPRRSRTGDGEHARSSARMAFTSKTQAST